MAQDSGPPGTTAQPTDVGQVTDTVLAHVANHVSVDALGLALGLALVHGLGGLVDGLQKGGAGLGEIGGVLLRELEKPVLPLFGGFVTPIVKGLFGTEVDESIFTSLQNVTGRGDAAAALVNAFLEAIERDAPTPSEPNMEGSRRLATAATRATIEGWFNAFVGENLAEAIPWDWLRLKELTKLPEEVMNALGVGRLVRSALLPLVTATAVEPMRWAANKKYRPTKIGTATVARQLARGRWTDEQAHEELARDGYTNDKIDAILNEASKFYSVAELELLVRLKAMSLSDATQVLRDTGWGPLQAPTLLNLEGYKRLETFERAMADAAITAYVDGRIDSATLDTYAQGDSIDHEEQQHIRLLAQARRALRQIHLSPAEAEACVLNEIVPLSEYRQALERFGYVPDAVDALEMLLRKKLDDKKTVAEHRAELAAEKAAAEKLKADATAQKKADAEAAAAVKRLGSPAELARAVVRGLIPIARLEQVLVHEFDSDTVAIYVADVEAQRQDYLTRQQHAADAAKRAAAKGLSTGELQTALVDGVLTVDEVRQQLAEKGLDAGDVDVLLATMQDAAANHAAAVRTREQAAARASARHVDLAQAERLVRAGHWTLAQFNALLTTLGFTEAAIADLDTLLEDQIAKDQAAAALRAGVAAGNATKGLSLAQARQAVILGVTTIQQFQTFLVHAGYTADAIATLVAEVGDAVTAADAARTRRGAARASAVDGRSAALADVTKAARLGVITPAAYQAELVARGYGADDVALEMDLLLTELAATRASQAVHPTAPAAKATGLALSQIAGAVKAGEASIDAYRARAFELGYRPADVDTLVNVLTDEVNTLAFATQRHTTIAGMLTLQGVDLAGVEAAVVAGTRTLDDYEQWLTAAGVGAADAALLRALLATKLGVVGG